MAANLVNNSESISTQSQHFEFKCCFLTTKSSNQGSDWASVHWLPLTRRIDFKLRPEERGNRDIGENWRQIKIIFVKIIFVQCVKKCFEFLLIFLGLSLKLKRIRPLTWDGLGANILGTHLLLSCVLGALPGPFVGDFGTNWYKLALFHIWVRIL